MAVSLATTIPQNEVGEGAKAYQEPRGSTTGINDAHFIKDLNRLKELRSFLLQEAIPISPSDSAALSLGNLNLLQCDANGRAPTPEEWAALENRTQALFRLLSDPLRRRFLLGEIPQWVSTLPIWLALAALVALTTAIVVQGASHQINTGARILPFYLIWLMSLGAIGSVAFIGMNALSVQQDVTFDLTNRRLILLRIALGALFALVLTLPFGFRGFMWFVNDISAFNPAAKVEPSSTVFGGSTQAMLLLLPFILGFSTSLVIVILNRLMDGIQAFFGRNGAPDGQASPATSPSHPASREGTSLEGIKSRQ